MSNKILIVDDEPFNLDLLEQELMEYDYVIERAVDGAQALDKVAEFQPDVVLLDYMMPKMNGLEVLQHLRADERFKSLPVILLTAKATQEDRSKASTPVLTTMSSSPSTPSSCSPGCAPCCALSRCTIS